MLHVLLADDEVIYAAGMAHVLRQQPDMYVLPLVHTATDLERAIDSSEGGVAVISKNLVTDLPTFQQRARNSKTGLILLLSARAETKPQELEMVAGALRRGDSPRELVQCVRTVAAGGRCILPHGDNQTRISAGQRVLQQLSPRQLQVVQETAAGAKNAEIARKIGTSEQVVKNMLRDIYDMAGVSDRLELALFVLHHPELANAMQPPAKGEI